jgi:hypothetical protein
MIDRQSVISDRSDVYYLGSNVARDQATIQACKLYVGQ